MKTIKLPAPITLRNNDGSLVKDASDQPVTINFPTFVLNTLLIDNKFGKSMSDILSAVAIREKVLEATDEVVLDDADYNRLLDVLENPTNNYNPAICLQIVSFMLAIKNAK